jgi:hypothetical protein
MRLAVSSGASRGERSPAAAFYLGLNLEKSFVAVRTMPNYSRYGDAWHSNLEVPLPGRCTEEATRRVPASEPVRQEEVMYHADRAASAAPEATPVTAVFY